MKNVLVLGATGATGKCLVNQLLSSQYHVTALVRPEAIIPEAWLQEERLILIKNSISQMSSRDIGDLVSGCEAVFSCLGHTLSLKGIYGKPRKLVKEAIRKVCEAIQSQSDPTRKVKVILMNTAGNQNRDLQEPVSMGEKIAIGILRLLLPPHTDNESAADYLRTQIGQHHPNIEWAVVRPDTLLNESEVTPYEVHPSPTRSALFNPGKTSRMNTAHFMAELSSDKSLWQQWKGKMPVIYNREI